MAINATTPTIIPAEGAKTYDKYWVTSVNIMGRDPGQPVRAVATLRKARILESGEYELSPNDSEVRLVIKDLYGTAAGNADLAAVVSGVITQIQTLAAAQNLI